MLQTNVTLTSLDLRGNEMGDDVLNALVEEKDREGSGRAKPLDIVGLVPGEPIPQEDAA